MKKYLNDLRSQKHFFGKIQIAEITNKRYIWLHWNENLEDKPPPQRQVSTWEKVFATYVPVKWAAS